MKHPLPLFLILLLGFVLVGSTVSAQDANYKVHYSDGDSVWILTDFAGSQVFNGTFSEVWNYCQANVSLYETVRIYGTVTLAETLNSTTAINFYFDRVNMTADKPAIFLNGTKTDRVLSIQNIFAGTGVLSNSTPLIKVENCFWQTIEIGNIYTSDDSGIALELIATAGEGTQGNILKLSTCWGLNTGLLFYAEGTGWISENTVKESVISCSTSVNFTTESPTSGAIFANDFYDCELNGADYVVWFEGDLGHNWFYGVRFWDIGGSVIAYHANATVAGTAFFGGMVRTDRSDYWDDNGSETLIVDWQPTEDWNITGFPTPDPTTPPTESTDDKTLLVEFVIVLAIVGIIGGAIGLRRYY